MIFVTFKIAYTNYKFSLDILSRDSIIEIYHKVINYLNDNITNYNNLINSDKSLFNIDDLEIIYADEMENGSSLESFQQYYINDLNNYNLQNCDIYHVHNWRNAKYNNERTTNIRWNIVNNICINNYFRKIDRGCDKCIDLDGTKLSFYIRIFDPYISPIILNQSICTICNELPSYTQRFICNHSYCDDCINTWIQQCLDNNYVPSCPMCRNSVRRLQTQNYTVPDYRNVLSTMSNNHRDSEQMISIN